VVATAKSVSDPVRLLQLLWSPPGPLRRSGLSLDAVVAAATWIAAEEGVTALTMRRVAAAVDVAPMSLYSHVPGKAELIELMIDAFAADLYEDDHAPASAGTWRAAAQSVAVRNFEAALAQPWTLDVPAGRAVPGPGMVRKYDIELAALDGIGLTDVEMDHALTALLGLAYAAARTQVGLDRARGASGDSDSEWWHQVAPALTSVLHGRFPLAQRVGTAASVAADASADPRGALNYGVGLLLDGLETATSDRRPPQRQDPSDRHSRH
jgi:AcrR family transcriptional regulator